MEAKKKKKRVATATLTNLKRYLATHNVFSCANGSNGCISASGTHIIGGTPVKSAQRSHVANKETGTIGVETTLNEPAGKDFLQTLGEALHPISTLY